MTHPKYVYKKRTVEDVEKRANQQGGNFIGIIKDAIKTYTSPKGENYIRVCPNPESETHYGMDVWVHYSVGPQNANVICLMKMSNKPCHTCQMQKALEEAGRDEEAKDLKPTKRVLMYLADRKQPDVDHPFAWLMPWTLDRDISKACKDRITGEVYYIDDPEEGYDITFENTKEGDFTKYIAVQVGRRPCSLGLKHGDKFMDFILENPLSSILIWRTFEEQKELYGGGTAPDASSNAPAAESASERFDTMGRAVDKEGKVIQMQTADTAKSATAVTTDTSAQAAGSTQTSPSEEKPRPGRPQISLPPANSAASDTGFASASPSPTKTRAELLRERFPKKS